MRLPSVEETSSDPFIASLRQADSLGYFSQRWGANQKFITTHRFDLCAELIKKHTNSSPGHNILVGDFACGTANLGINLAEQGYRVDLVENEAKFFDYIKLKTDSKNLRFITADASSHSSKEKYDAIFFGEAIEHMAAPDKVLKLLCENLKLGGILCLTTPNGRYIDCNEPSWEEVKLNVERNKKLANTFGNHVCEFTPNELQELTKMAGFCIAEHRFILSKQVCKSPLMRRIIPKKILWKLDEKLSKGQDQKTGKMGGKIQIVIARRARS
ncbi:MAG: methyltransferase domain-containing protein [Bacteriovoracales bacterium]|nr:methyltransferase domain-containing protein [Bacteriovoracales bacterium]